VAVSVPPAPRRGFPGHVPWPTPADVTGLPQ